MTEQIEQKVLTANEVVEKLVPIFEEINLLSEDASAIVAEAKKAGLDGAAITKVAKAKAADKLGDLTDKTEALMDLIESVS